MLTEIFDGRPTVDRLAILCKPPGEALLIACTVVVCVFLNIL